MPIKMHAEDIHQRIVELLRLRHRFLVATILEVKGSSPQKPGARMVVHPDGTFEFTLGGGTFEAEVLRDALSCFSATSPFSREYRLTVPDLGMYCQGVVKVWFEPYVPRPQLLIFGGGHVGQALSRVAASTGIFSVTVVDDREEYAAVEKHPHADEVVLTDRNFIEGVPEVDSETFIVIVTRCHATDKLLVHRYAGCPAAYVGLIGSASKIRIFRRELESEGMPASRFDTMHAPIGLRIGGKTPAEIAVSILAEIIQAKNEKLQGGSIAEMQLKRTK